MKANFVFMEAEKKQSRKKITLPILVHKRRCNRARIKIKLKTNSILRDEKG